MKRQFWFVSRLAILVLLFASCTTPATPAPPAGETAPAATEALGLGPTEAPTEPGAATASPAEPAAAAGSVTIVQDSDVTALDPTLNIGSQSISAQLAIYDPIVYQTPDNELVPWLATSWEAVEPTRWRFTLREDVTFHNGEPFNADSVVFSINTYNASQGEAAPFFTFVTDMEVVDPYTVDIITDAPNPTVPAAMAFLFALPPTYYTEQGPEGFNAAPVGTGPFTFEQWQEGVQIVLRANPDYWGESSNVGEVVFKVAPEASTRVAMLETGEADIIVNVPPELTERVNGSGTGRILDTPSLRMIFVEFNPFQEPFDDVRVRQAFNYAVNKESIINDILGGYATQVKGVILPDWPGYNPDALTEYAYDPERARALLAEAGYPDGLTVDFWHPIGRYLKDKEVTEAIAGQLAEVGIQTNLQGSDIGTLVDRIHTQELSGMHFFSMAPRILDPDYLFRTHFYSEGLNRYGWTAETDQWVEEASSTVDQDERAQLYEQMDQFLTNEHVPWIYLYLQNLIYGVSDRLEWTPHPNEMMDVRLMQLR